MKTCTLFWREYERVPHYILPCRCTKSSHLVIALTSRGQNSPKEAWLVKKPACHHQGLNQDSKEFVIQEVKIWYINPLKNIPKWEDIVRMNYSWRHYILPFWMIFVCRNVVFMKWEDIDYFFPFPTNNILPNTFSAGELPKMGGFRTPCFTFFHYFLPCCGLMRVGVRFFERHSSDIEGVRFWRRRRVGLCVV